MWKRIKQGLATMLSLSLLLSAMPSPVAVYADQSPADPMLSEEELLAIARPALERDGLEWGGPEVTSPDVYGMGTWVSSSVPKDGVETKEDAAEEILTIAEHFFGGGQFTIGPAQQSLILQSLRKVEYNSWGTDYFQCSDGTVTYCTEPAKGTPATGDTASYTANRMNTSDDMDNWLRSILYYGYGGPGYETAGYGLKNKLTGTNLDGDNPYIITHIMLSYAYDYRNYVRGGRSATYGWTWTKGMTGDFVDGCQHIADTMWDCMGTVPANYNGYLFNEGSATQAMAYGWTESVGAIMLNKASANEALTNNNPNYSLEGATYYIYDGYTGDPNYFEYHFETDATGKGWAVNSAGTRVSDRVTIGPGTYFVQEYTASKGYERDTQWYIVNVTAGQVSYVNYDENTGIAAVYEKPLNDPLNITIYKQDANGREVSNLGSTTLEGAEYTVYYFTDTTITSTAAGSLDLSTAFKHWTIKTMYKAASGKYVARLDREHFVSGDALFTDENDAFIFPIGTYIITETKAPTGYQIAGNTFSYDGVTTTNNRMVVHITADGNGDINVDCGNTIIQSEKEISGGVEIAKKDADTNTAVPQGNATFLGAEYTIVNNGTASVIVGGTTYAAGAAVMTLTTDPYGRTATLADALPYGDFYIYETKAPNGYKIDGTHHNFSIRDGGEYFSFTNDVTDPVIRGGVKIRKNDNDLRSNTPQGAATLEGAVYKITTKSTNPVVVNGTAYSNGEVVARITTDANGDASISNALPYGAYEIQEESASNGYLVNPAVHSFTIQTDGQMVDLTNGETVESVKRGGVELTKQDADTNTAVAQGTASLAGAEYTVVNDNGKSVVVNGTVYAAGQPILTMTTDAAGHAITAADLLPYGNYYLYETKAPTGYKLDGTHHAFTISEAGVVTVVTGVSDTVIHGGVKIQKQDAELSLNTAQGSATLAGAVYKITSANTNSVVVNGTVYGNGEVVARITTDAGGNASISNALPYGDYKIQEESASNGYQLNPAVISFSIESDGQMVDLTGGQTVESVKRGGVSLVKIDKETMQPVAQGDASLAGAKYAIVTENDAPVVVEEVTYQKGATVKTITTDRLGRAATAADSLPVGDYYLVETAPSEGYLINTTKIYFSITEHGQIVEIGNKTTEQVKKQAFQLLKISSNGTNTEAAIVKDAQFTVKLRSDILANGWDMAKVYDVLTTDELGYAKSVELPYGTYTVRETRVPENMTAVQDFTVVVTEDSRTAQAWRVFNDTPYEAYVKIVKRDSVSGKTILLSGVTFKLYDIANDKYVTQKLGRDRIDTYVTDADGMTQTPLKLASGDYELREITAPEGYLLNTDYVRFTIGSSAPAQVELDEDGEPVVVVEMEDQPVTGTVTISKHGEVLVDAKEIPTDPLTVSVIGSLFRHGTEFVYEDQPLAGCIFTVVAEEDIYTPDHQMDENGERTIAVYNGVVLKEGAVAATVVSDADGIAKVAGLPLGHYYVEEAAVCDGYLRNRTVDHFSLEYAGDSVAVVSYDSDYENTRVKAALNLVKTGTKTDTPVSGAEYGLFCKEDITAYDGTVLLPADSLIETAITDEDGAICFTADLPLMPYYVKELISPAGYVKNETVYDVDLSYVDDETPVILATVTAADEEIVLSISKQDATTGAELPGAELTLFTADGEVYETWTSGEEPHILMCIPKGTYTLHEDLAPLGYATASDVVIEVTETAELQKAVMEDEIIKLSISKKDATNGEELPGAKLTLYTADGEVYDEWTSGEEPHLIEKIPTGTYRLHEDLAPLGYATASDITFEVKDTAEIQEVEMQDEIIRVSISKEDATTGKELPGAELTLYDADGEVYDAWTSGKEPHVLEKIPTGTYRLHEDLAPLGYATASDVTIEVKDTAELQKVTMKDEIIKVSISKQDATTGKELPGAELTLYDSDGKIYETWTSGEKPHVIEKIPEGEYLLHEYLAPLGYTTASDVKITIKNTGELQKAVMKDEAIRLSISKQDATTGEELPGAKLTLYTADGEVYDEWTSGEEPHILVCIPKGTYRLHEDLAPLGYATASDVVIEVMETAELQKAVMKDEITQLSISKKDATNGEELPGAELTLFDADGNVYEKWTSEKEPHVLEKIPTGTYRLHEDLAPLGYATASDITFEVKDTAEIQEVEMQDEITRISISKRDITTDEELPGAHLQILCEDGSVYEEWDSGEEPHLIEKIPTGNYMLREITAPEGYEVANDVAFTVLDTGEVQSVIMYDEHTPEVPKMGDSAPLRTLGILAGVSALIGTVSGVMLRRRKKRIVKK